MRLDVDNYFKNVCTEHDVQTSEQDGVGAHHAPELGEADDAVPVPVHHLQHLLSLLTQYCRNGLFVQVSRHFRFSSSALRMM